MIGLKIKIPLRGIIAAILSFTVCVAVLTAAVIKKEFMPLRLSTAFKISEIKELVEKDFYFGVDNEKLSEAVVSGYVDGLGDSYSEYYNTSRAEEYNDKLVGESFGIGLIAVPEKSGLYVWRVYDGGPADTAGIKPCDIITEIGGQPVTELTVSDALELLKGKDEEVKKLKVKRGSEVLNFELKCEDCDVQTVFAYVSDQHNVGRVEVLSFNKKTSTQFKAAVDSLVEMGVKGIVIDLRHNGGGTVESAAQMLDYLLPKGDTLHIKYNDGKIRTRNTSDKNSVDIPFAILTDSKTASASELFACTMRDYGKAVLIGGKTYGKFVIQRTYTLSDGTKVKFTVAEFVSASGESFNGVGLTPDIEVDVGDYDGTLYYFMSETEDEALQRAFDYFDKLG